MRKDYSVPRDFSWTENYKLIIQYFQLMWKEFIIQISDKPYICVYHPKSVNSNLRTQSKYWFNNLAIAI